MAKDLKGFEQWLDLQLFSTIPTSTFQAQVQRHLLLHVNLHPLTALGDRLKKPWQKFKTTEAPILNPTALSFNLFNWYSTRLPWLSFSIPSKLRALELHNCATALRKSTHQNTISELLAKSEWPGDEGETKQQRQWKRTYRSRSSSIFQLACSRHHFTIHLQQSQSRGFFAGATGTFSRQEWNKNKSKRARIHIYFFYHHIYHIHTYSTYPYISIHLQSIQNYSKLLKT